ncbi:MAG TPA: glucose-6-phosphate isomerase [Dehalococcoidia bacterium]|nr:glucose-6-phosphate isomerase [Dehalococcoidia bacterium]
MRHDNIVKTIIESALSDLDRRDIVRRIWQKDHTVWKPQPAEITNRLGWLTVADLMREHLAALQSFALDIANSGIKHIVLLGMGGSSLGAEVLRQTFGTTHGFPELIILDSTVPDSIRFVKDSIDLHHTLFMVSSKSGSTTEPLMFYRYFRELIESTIGSEKAGEHFIAITDSGTPLADIAARDGFRRVFTNPADIGGRYSVLSYFGLAPAVAAGININLLIERSRLMKAACASHVPIQDNPAVHLGAYMGSLALQGRDKLTLFTSPSVHSFGLWLEQLIAESTGKEGKGIIPIVDEPLYDVFLYGEDRCFVYLRCQKDDNSITDNMIKTLASSGHPILTIDIQDIYDLGAEFYRWEFATAVAGALLQINPFDQPNVQQSKRETESILDQYARSQRLPENTDIQSPSALFAGVEKNDYCAIMAYMRQTPQTDEQLTELRRRITKKYGIATTLGYGPRFLHSTGQLHKGGPGSGIFLQIVIDTESDIPVPGAPYTFGIIAAAQALGDIKALQSAQRRIASIRLPADKDMAIQKVMIRDVFPLLEN